MSSLMYYKLEWCVRHAVENQIKHCYQSYLCLGSDYWIITSICKSPSPPPVGSFLTSQPSSAHTHNKPVKTPHSCLPSVSSERNTEEDLQVTVWDTGTRWFILSGSEQIMTPAPKRPLGNRWLTRAENQKVHKLLCVLMPFLIIKLSHTWMTVYLLTVFSPPFPLNNYSLI